jgi:L-malate glycosyltransferase
MKPLKETLKILLLNYEHPPVGGGGGVSTMRLAKALAKKGHHVDILTTWFDGLKKVEKVDGYTVYRVKVLGRTDLKAASNVSMFTFPLSSVPKGIELCLRNKYDIINTHFYAPTGPTGFILSMLFGIPNVLYIHGADVFDPSRLNKTPAGKGIIPALLRLSTKLQNWRAKAISCQSSDTKSNIERYIKPQKPITIIPLPFEAPIHPKTPKWSLRKELGLEKDLFYILCAGRVVQRKGYQYLIRALAKLDKNIHVNIVSEGPDIEKLENLATDLGVKDRIVFQSKDHYIEYDEWYKFFAASDLFVMPSLHEGMGIAIQEAMEFGLPVVSTNSGGQKDLIIEERNGYLIDPKSVNQLVKTITKVFLSRFIREKMAKNNKEDIRKFYADKIADRFVDLYKSALKK